MLKMAKEAEPRITDDPRTLTERAVWQRMRIAAEALAVHPDWGTALYALHRAGRIDNDQREVGDKYARLIKDRRKLWLDPMGQIAVYRAQGFDHLEKRSVLTADVERMMGHVVADGMREESEFETKRARRITEKYNEARAVAGPINQRLEDLLIDDIWPISEVMHLAIGHALTRLYHFFLTGTNRERRKRV